VFWKVVAKKKGLKDVGGRPGCTLWSWALFVMVSIFIFSAACGVAQAMIPADQDNPATVKMVKNPELKFKSEQTWTDDLCGLEKRGVIRVLVEYSRTDFFIVHGELYGFEYELLREYESFLNRNRPGKLRIRMVFVPTPLSEIIPALEAGKGDIAAAGLTVTPQRQGEAAFSTPYVDRVSEIVVSALKAAPIQKLEQLCGHSLWVVRGSSHGEHLRTLSEEFVQRGLKPIDIVEAPKEFTEEDLLEMTNAGICSYIVVDSRTADIWAKVLPKIVVHPDIRVASEGKIAWAVRKNNPQLLASINSYLHEDQKGALAKAGKLVQAYYKNTRWVLNPEGNAYTKKLRNFAVYFRSCCKTYDFDWLMAAALAFQESRFDERLVSKTGAVGLMQVLPGTAAEMGFRKLKQPKENISAGVCYLNQMEHNYFIDPEIPVDQRLYFLLASYNAGPNRVSRLRKIASKMGLNPNVWFGNVEFAALNAMGGGVLNYVANIKKYYIIYRMAHELEKRRARIIEEIKEKAK
jgi:membrane-bound lytic murein transglycosylase MltF